VITKISRSDFLDSVFREKSRFLDSIRKNEVYVVRQFYPRERIVRFREFLRAIREESPPSWHPCLDGCPDYHRINDEYPKSYVRAKPHAYFFHRWNDHKDIFKPFKEIFEIKNFLGGAEKDAYYDALPSDGVISRIVCHQYPRGGGYMAEHKDPVNPFSLIQTIIQASDFGEDYSSGGLYIRDGSGDEALFVDAYTEMGDMVVASTDVWHDVAPVDPGEKLDWEREDGRWIILPVIIRSDYNSEPLTKPQSRKLEPSV
jgi:hypothetical protein